MFRDPPQSDKTRGERGQLPPERLRQKERQRRGLGGENRTIVRQKEKRREMADLPVPPKPERSLQNMAGSSRKTQAHQACGKGKSSLSDTERLAGKHAKASLAKRKRNGAVCPEHQTARGGGSQGE